jgi:tetratricopeptide (TPR) repeat protein
MSVLLGKRTGALPPSLVSSPPQAASRRGHVVALLVALLCSAGAALLQTFVFDDVYAVLAHPAVTGSEGWRSAFQTDFWGAPMHSARSHKSFRPLTTLSFRADAALHGLEARGFHVTNVALHVAVCLLFARFCRSVVFAPRERGAALFAALLFAVHPVHVEAFANIVGRAEILSAGFFLAALFCFQASISGSAAGGVSALSPLPLAYLCAAASMLCKETGVAVFGVFVVWEGLMFLRTLATAAPPAGLKVHAARAALHLAVLALLLVPRLSLNADTVPCFGVVDNQGAFNEDRLTRALTLAHYAAQHAWLLIFPSQLACDRSFGSIPLVTSWSDPRNVYSAGLFAGVLAVGLYALALSCRRAAHRSPHAAGLGVAILLGPFLPASNIFFPVGFTVAERILYAPSMGFCILAAVLLASLIRTLRRWRPSLVLLLGVAIAAALACMGTKSIAQSRVWSDGEALGRAGLRHYPHNPKLHLLIAQGLIWRADRQLEVLRSLSAAANTTEGGPAALEVSNVSAAVREMLQEAELRARLAFKLNREQHLPNNRDNQATLHGVAIRAFNAGNFEQAIRCFRLLLTYDFGDLVDHRKYLGRSLLSAGQPEEAWPYLRMAFDFRPHDKDLAAWLVDLASTFHDSGDHGRELEVLQYVEGVQPDLCDAVVQIPIALRLLGRYPEALKAGERAVHQFPRDFRPLLTLGHTHAQMGSYSAAEAAYEQCLALNPDAEAARTNLAAIRARRGVQVGE